MGFDTDVIHAGQKPDAVTGAVSVPIYQTSTYVQESIGKHKGYEYARSQNPTREAYERCVAALEGGIEAYAFASGLAGISAVVKLLKAGDHVIAADNMYGGTYRMFETIYRPLGIRFDYVNTFDLAAVKAAIEPATRMIFTETPTNPMMIVSDISALAEIAKKQKAHLVVDNTFLTPYFQRPLELGADVVLHSATKYLNGHADVVSGIVTTNQPEVAERLRFVQNAEGAIPGPNDCFLALRGIKTLAVRMPRHATNARSVAEFVREHARVAAVYYPGFKDHPGYEISRKQTTGFGGMVAFDLATFEEAQTVASKLRIFQLAESLGGVESLVCHPASMTHAAVPRAEREKRGFTDNLLRLSVGIEDPDDLIEDLRNALS